MTYKSLVCSILMYLSLFIYCAKTNSAIAQNFDIETLRSLHLQRNTGLDGTFKLITKTATPVSIGVPLTLFAVSRIKKDSLLYKQSLKCGIAIAATMTISTLMKYGINRQRPYETYPEIHPLSSDFTPSFPSGHTASVFSTATTLSIYYPKWYVIVPAYTWASSVAYSRLHMGMHYPSDVIGGIIVGSGSAYLAYILQKKLFK